MKMPTINMKSRYQFSTVLQFYDPSTNRVLIYHFDKSFKKGVFRELSQKKSLSAC